MALFFYRISYLTFGTEITKRKRQSPQPRAGLPIEFIGYIVFAGRGHQKILEVMMLIKIPGESVKFMDSKCIQESFIDMSQRGEGNSESFLTHFSCQYDVT